MTAADEVLAFWFDGVDDVVGPGDAARRWFGGDAGFDTEIRERFGALVATALGGGLPEWEDDVRHRLALILVLDQFPRNIFRHSARAFAGDARALRLARRTVDAGEHRKLGPAQRCFLLMPFQHAEDPATQDEGVRLFEQLLLEEGSQAWRELLLSALDFARRHQAIIARFGRFPHRNDALERTMTADEARWLRESGERFGQ